MEWLPFFYNYKRVKVDAENNYIVRHFKNPTIRRVLISLYMFFIDYVLLVPLYLTLFIIEPKTILLSILGFLTMYVFYEIDYIVNDHIAWRFEGKKFVKRMEIFSIRKVIGMILIRLIMFIILLIVTINFASLYYRVTTIRFLIYGYSLFTLLLTVTILAYNTTIPKRRTFLFSAPLRTLKYGMMIFPIVPMVPESVRLLIISYFLPIIVDFSQRHALRKYPDDKEIRVTDPYHRFYMTILYGTPIFYITLSLLLVKNVSIEDLPTFIFVLFLNTLITTIFTLVFYIIGRDKY